MEGGYVAPRRIQGRKTVKSKISKNGYDTDTIIKHINYRIKRISKLGTVPVFIDLRV